VAFCASDTMSEAVSNSASPRSSASMKTVLSVSSSTHPVTLLHASHYFLLTYLLTDKNRFGRVFLVTFDRIT